MNWARLGVAAIFLFASAVIPASAEPGPVTVTPWRVNSGLGPVKDGDGKQYNLSLTVSKTANLQPRERVKLSWSGFEPTRNYTVQDPVGVNRSEFGVVVLQCWGVDSKEKPLAPQQCATTAPRQVSNQLYKDTGDSTEAPGGITGRALGFTDVKGKQYKMKIAGADPLDTAPPDLQSSSVVPVNNLRSWSSAQPRTDVSFEVLGDKQMPSLGCSAAVKCSIVVVPILKPVCVAGASAACKAAPKYPVGPGAGDAPNTYLATSTWWLGMNWQNRMAVEVTMAPAEEACDRGDNRPSVDLAGSELDSVLMRSWVPAFCLDAKRFKLGYTRLAEPTARDQFVNPDLTGTFQQNAILTTWPVTESPRPVVHAPVSATGFAVTFLIDGQTGLQNTRMRLTPRLLAKLLTESYAFVLDHPTVGGNPLSLLKDPEFLAVNPGFDLPDIPNDPKNLIITIERTDILGELTRYIESDPDAKAWLDGAPDEFSGMVVNPLFRGYSLPTLVAERRDSWVPPAGGPQVECRKLGVPIAANTAQPVESLERGAEAMLNLQSPATTNCALDGTYQWKKNPRQVAGDRNLIALTSVALAEQYKLPMAELQVHKLAGGQRVFAGPSAQGMTAALGYTAQEKKTGTLGLDFKTLAPNAYPGTMLTYGAIPTSGLGRPLADQYADYLAYAATDGQTPGAALGNLPPGYVPLPQVLRDYTKQAANAVREQKAEVPPPPTNLPGAIRDELGQPGGTTNLPPVAAPAAAAAPPAAEPTPSAAPAAEAGGRPTTVAQTRGTESWLASWGLPLLLGIGVLAGLLAPLILVANQPGHPVRRLFARILRRS